MGRKKTTDAGLKEVRFENSRLTALGIEALTWSALRSKIPVAWLGQPERVDFFMLMLVTAGAGRHTVDFVEWPLIAGSLIAVRPGQVQQWHPDDGFEAQVILIAPNTLPHSTGLTLAREMGLLRIDEWTTALVLDAETMPVIDSGFQQLRRDFDLFSGDDLDIALIRHQLMALMLRIATRQHRTQTDSPATSASRLTYRLFIQALEAGFAQNHSLQHYAKRLGYSESTISRACVALEGRSAKQVINRRIALEAQRLLVHSTASVAQIAYQLGFSESTNFVKFFRRQIGQSPSRFRQILIRPNRV